MHITNNENNYIILVIFRELWHLNLMLTSIHRKLEGWLKSESDLKLQTDLQSLTLGSLVSSTPTLSLLIVNSLDN